MVIWKQLVHLQPRLILQLYNLIVQFDTDFGIGSKYHFKKDTINMFVLKIIVHQKYLFIQV